MAPVAGANGGDGSSGTFRARWVHYSGGPQLRNLRKRLPKGPCRKQSHWWGQLRGLAPWLELVPSPRRRRRGRRGGRHRGEANRRIAALGIGQDVEQGDRQQAEDEARTSLDPSQPVWIRLPRTRMQRTIRFASCLEQKGVSFLERLKVAMEAEPTAYINAIETNAAHLMGEAPPSTSTIEKYVREELPLGNEKTLGFVTWGIARALTMMSSKQTDKAHLVLLLTLAAIEQYRLDSSWHAAWKLTMLSQPPLAEWRSKESVLPQLRADHEHSRLVHATWAAAVVARIKDEEVLNAPPYPSRSPGETTKGKRPRTGIQDIKVTEERAASTPVGHTWQLRDFRGSHAAHSLCHRLGCKALPPNMSVSVCFAGLSMGDAWAPCIAQVSHEHVLSAFGALRKEEHLQLGLPMPRSPEGHFSGVCIDDKVFLQLFPSFVPAGADPITTPARDAEACYQADVAYAAVNLETHPKKRIRRAAVFKAWGAHVDGDSGIISMDRTRLVNLIVCTAQVTQLGVCTQHLLQRLAGLWAFAFQFRRPLFSVFQDLYHLGHPNGQCDAPFRLTRSVKQELQLAAALGMLAISDLRAQVVPQLFGTDASPDGAGIVTCHVGSCVAQELYRRNDMRGFYTRLLSG